jgi:CelD/BcsL family acetyltransferase involved in cellulose biosynthesis
MPDRLRVEEIADVAGLEALRADWLDLWRRVPAATPFQSPAWLVPWWRAFDDGELMALALRAGGRLVGLAPLYILRENGTRKLLPVGIGISDFLDPLIEPAHVAAAMREIIDWLAAQAHRFDRADLESQREGSPWLEASWPLGWQVQQHASEPCTVLALPEAGAPAAQVLSRHRRKRLRYYWRRAEALGPTRIELASEADLDEFLTALHQLHSGRWRERGEPGVMADPRVRAFHRLAAPGLLEQESLRLYGLRVGERLVAVLHTMADRQRLYAYLNGFDPDLPQLSPGTLTIAHMIQQAARDGMREIHFLRGRERYKYDWGAIDRPTYGLRLEPPRY